MLGGPVVFGVFTNFRKKNDLQLINHSCSWVVGSKLCSHQKGSLMVNVVRTQGKTRDRKLLIGINVTNHHSK